MRSGEPSNVSLALWQERVKRTLLEHADDPDPFHVREWQTAD